MPASGHGGTSCGLAPGNLPRHARGCVCRPRSSIARHNEHGSTQVSLRFLRHVSEQPRIRHIQTPSQPVCACHCLFARLTLHSGFRQAFQPEPNFQRGSASATACKKEGKRHHEDDCCRSHECRFVTSPSVLPAGPQKLATINYRCARKVFVPQNGLPLIRANANRGP